MTIIMVMTTVMTITDNYCKINSKCNSNKYNNFDDIGKRDNKEYGKEWWKQYSKWWRHL